MEWTWPESTVSSNRQRAVEVLAIQGREMANLQVQRCITSDARSAEGFVRKILLVSFTNTDRILNGSQEVKEEELISRIQANNNSTFTGTAFAAAGADPVQLMSQIQANGTINTASRSAPGDADNALEDAVKSKCTDEESCKRTKRLKDRRGSYKRRNMKDSSWTKDTTDLVDDGHAWRKYGQKTIQNTRHQRNYYRCTNKFDQGCNASKHVQRIKDEPQLFRTTYYGKHTCTDYSRVSDELVLDCSSSQESSQNMIRFDATTPTTTSPSLQTRTSPFLSFTSIKQESVKEEDIITPVSVNDHVTHHKQSWSSWCDSLMSPGRGVFEYDSDDVISRIKVAYFDGHELDFPYEF